MRHDDVGQGADRSAPRAAVGLPGTVMACTRDGFKREASGQRRTASRLQ
jgi:hypothetical protein